jgi:hypothetical protein
VPTRATNDPNVVIDDLEGSRVTYRDLTTGDRWIEIGPCNQCGLCVDADDPDVDWTGIPGEPGACRDRLYEIRPHYVTRPSILSVVPQCVLRFEVLDD